MPWYWTDDIARLLLDTGRINQTSANPMLTVPTGIRRDETTLEAAALALLDDDEIPLAA